MLSATLTEDQLRERDALCASLGAAIADARVGGHTIREVRIGTARLYRAGGVKPAIPNAPPIVIDHADVDVLTLVIGPGGAT
ncbi:hypothetical protein [Sandaracinus amylolyticus]|uniref:hypothetical protein n=1 Tax=Sandaracinus amylolyticus TaxID=927083 RepID=UPI001F225018|nr:hypothetical protein [Sandaracinus amylolyticus]UJR81460.1 Hypothetical protein I5071_35190 [Sandaracinus amylolyticus]